MASLDDPRVEEPPPPMASGDADAPLRAYVSAKQGIAQLLREIRQLAEASAPWVADRVHDLMVRLAEDRFQLVVVGQFKRGKTSLMNAILGRPLLPTGSIPVTSAVTSLRYGSAVRAVIRRAGQRFDQEIPVTALPEFITERGNPGNCKQVLSADIEVPAAFLRRGLHFIDTPGIGSAHEQNTATTLAFLPEADAAIFVTGADAPLSEGELDFLDAVHQHVRKLFFVLNKIDQLSMSERDEVVAYTSQLLAHRLGVDDIRVFPVSAALALGGDTADAATLVASGLSAFEGALATFLNEDRRRAFLVAVLDRMVRLLDETQYTLNLRQRATSPTSDQDEKRSALNGRYQEQDQRRRAVVDRAADIVANWTTRVLDPALNRFAVETREALSGALASASQSWSTSRDEGDASGNWLRGELERHGAHWLRDMIDPVNEVADDIAHETASDVAAVLGNTLEIAGAVFGLPEQTKGANPTDPDIDRWRWEPPVLELPDVIPDLTNVAANAPAWVPVPHALAVRLATNRMAQRLPQEIDHATNALREVVLGHLNACVDDLDASSARALDEERQRIGLAVKPQDQQRGPTQHISADAPAQLHALLQRVTAVRDALLRQEPVDQLLVEAAESPTSTPASSEPEPIPSERPNAPAKSRIVTGTCTICAAVSDAVFDFLCHHQYAIATDRSTQRQFLASHGLCPTHTWHLERVASPRGLSASYPSLLEETAARLQAMVGHSAAGIVNGIHELLSGTIQCPACVARRNAERTAVEQIVRQLATPQGRGTFERSQWLCLAHLQLLLTVVDDPITGDLLRGHARRLVEMAESMREYVLKLDARRRELLTAEEQRAYRQALVLLIGERYLVATVPEE